MILILLSYLGGVLTILSPCILPVLPFVFAKAQGSFVKNGLPLLLGMALTFSLFSGIAILGGEWLGKANELGRAVALILMTGFGLSMIYPEIAEAAFAPVARLGNRVGGKRDSSALLIGISTGLLWAPCAGPILGLVLTGAAASGNKSAAIGLLLAYSLGAATSLSLALLAGNRFFKRMKGFLGVDKKVKRVIGIAVMIGVVIIAFNLDRTLLTRVSRLSTDSFENALLRMGGVLKKDTNMEPAPELEAGLQWLNSPPLTLKGLRGKVVLIDFWTYSCINCLRTLPHVKSWYDKYRDDGLVVIGVHSPEFAFEKNPDNVKKAIADLGITYPVVLDNDWKIFRAYQNRYWPAHYFIDRAGLIVHRQFGEGEYEQSEKVLAAMLGVPVKTAAMKMSEVEAPSKLDKNQSPETYLGYDRAKNFVSKPELQEDEEVEYKSPGELTANQWTVVGRWEIDDQVAITKAKDASLIYKFRGRDLHLVLGGKAAPFVVKIDGHEPGEDHGVDIDASGLGHIQGQRLYQLIRREKNDVESEHVFEIKFLAPEAEAYAFTFG